MRVGELEGLGKVSAGVQEDDLGVRGAISWTMCRSARSSNEHAIARSSPKRSKVQSRTSRGVARSKAAFCCVELVER